MPLPEPEVPPGLMKLHVGGEQVKEGWTLLNVKPMPGVDIIGSATDLSAVPDASCSHVYGSHVYEHLTYADEVLRAFHEAYRVLAPGGLFLVAVPDLDAMCRLFIDPRLTIDERFNVMRLIYGGQTDPWDFHKAGFNAELLAAYLYNAGFVDVQRWPSFGLFQDTSEMGYLDVALSLNVSAIKPKHQSS
jgi:predicted SAM-dependent methyltransferase